MKLFFPNWFTANAPNSPKLNSRVHCQQHFNFIIHHIKIFSYTIKIQLIFTDTVTNTSHKVTNYVAKQSFICLVVKCLKMRYFHPRHDTCIAGNGTYATFEEMVFVGTNNQINERWAAVDRSIYHKHLKHWLRIFPRKHVSTNRPRLHKYDLPVKSVLKLPIEPISLY